MSTLPEQHKSLKEQSIRWYQKRRAILRPLKSIKCDKIVAIILNMLHNALYENYLIATISWVYSWILISQINFRIPVWQYKLEKLLQFWKKKEHAGGWYKGLTNYMGFVILHCHMRMDAEETTTPLQHPHQFCNGKIMC